jgi:hypothetical protein
MSFEWGPSHFYFALFQKWSRFYVPTATNLVTATQLVGSHVACNLSSLICVILMRLIPQAPLLITFLHFQESAC